MHCMESQRHMERVLKASSDRHELLVSIEVSVFNALNELGLTKDDAIELLADTNKSSLTSAVYAGLTDYVRKLDSTGEQQ